MKPLCSLLRIVLLIFLLFGAWCMFLSPVRALAQTPALGTVTIVGVEADSYSAKVRYQPYPGAADYALLIVGSNTIKCAGLWHINADNSTWYYSGVAFANTGALVAGSPSLSYGLTYDLTKPWPYIETQSFPESTYEATSALWGEEHHADPPALEIEVNGLPAEQPVTAVIVALSALGPPPYLSLYGSNVNTYITRQTPLPSGYSTAGSLDALGSHNGHMEADSTGTLIIANGQNANPDANPTVLAASTPFTITATGDAPVPTTPTATGAIYDPLTQGAIAQVSSNPSAETESWNITTPATTWQAFASGVDTTDTQIAFQPGDIFSIIGVDGGTPGTNNPPHVGFGFIGLEGTVPESLANGAGIHIHVRIGTKSDDNRKYPAVGIFDAGDPITRGDWQEGLSVGGVPINKNQQFAFWELNGSSPAVVECNGGANPKLISVDGAISQATVTDSYPTWNHGVGRGDDDGSFLDIFAFQTWQAEFVDGQEVEANNWTAPLTWTSAEASVSDWPYHLILCTTDTRNWAQGTPGPADTVDTTLFPGNDERWIGDFGIEDLPASYCGNAAACAALLTKETFTTPPAAPAIPNEPTTQVTLAAFAQAINTPAPTLAQLQTQLAAVNAQIATANGQITALQAQIAPLTAQVMTLQGTVATLTGQAATLQGQIAKMPAQATVSP